MQPSELAKPALVIFLAFFVTWRARAINNPRYTLIPAAMAVGVVILLVVVADLGTAIVLGAAAGAGLLRRRPGIALLRDRRRAGDGRPGATSSAPKPYRLGRVIRFFDPQVHVLAKLDQERQVQGAPGGIAGHARHQLSAGAVAGRGGRGRSDRRSG